MTEDPKSRIVREAAEKPQLDVMPRTQEQHFKELCIAVAQLANSCRHLGLESVKLQMNPTDFMSINQHSLACGQDLYGMHSELHTNERKLATIPVVIQW